MIPSFTSMKIVEENGMPTPEFRRFLEILTQTLQGFLSDEGIKTPEQTTANIALLNTEKSTSVFLYDKELHEMKVCIDGLFKTIQTA